MLDLNKIYCEDCLEGMKKLDENSIDAIVTDPPYGLEFMGKKWDYGVPSIEIWKECLRVLKPGGYLLSFGGTRTCHRLTCAIEDAGFEIRDMIAWVYGSGFPKSLNIGKAVDKLQGNERENLGKIRDRGKPRAMVVGGGKRKADPSTYLTKGTSEWEGWGTALKPALEPITVARKPLSEKTVAKNVLKWGTGGINIDGCRVGLNDEKPPTGSAKRVYVKNQYTEDKIYGDNKETPSLGRFPANFIHDGSDEVVGLFPNSKGQQGDVRGTEASKTGGEGTNCYGEYNRIATQKRGDSGSASRFFYCAKASKSERNRGINGSFINMEVYILYGSDKCNEKSLIKEGKLAQLQMDMGQSQIKVIDAFGIQKKNDLEWNTTLFGKQLMERFQKDIIFTTKTGIQSITTSQILNWLMLYFTEEYTLDANSFQVSGGNPVGNVGKSKELIITINDVMELALGVKPVVSEMQLKIKLREEKNRCNHPTVKPIAFMEYLIKLVSREGATVLDPYIGSGTTGLACKLLNRKYIGFENNADYYKIAQARLSADIKKYRVHIDKKLIKDDELEDKPLEKDYSTRLDNWV